MDILHVYNQSDLDSANHNGIIEYDVYIHGGDFVSLKNISIINGYLGFANTQKIDLCDIVEIKGDLWVSTYSYIPQSINLSKLKRVGGSINLMFTPLQSLRYLEYVGGDANLRDTKIKGLDRLTYIGGKLSLPMRLKGNIDFAGICVNGKIKFYADIFSSQEDSRKGLIQSEIPVPATNKKDNIGSRICTLSEASIEQRHFYVYFKKKFKNGYVVDVKGFLEYPEFLLMEIGKYLNSPCISHNEIQDKLKDYDRLIKVYPQLDDMLAYEFRWNSKKYDIGWELNKRKKIVDVSRIGFYEEKLSQALFNVDFLLRLEGAVELSKWGKQHIAEIKPFIQEQYTLFERKWQRRFLQVFVDESLNPQKDYLFYKQFYIYVEMFDNVNMIEFGKFIPTNYEKPLPNIVEYAIRQQCKQFTINAEDNYRESIGMPKIGEFWKSETELYYSIKEAFKGTEVLQHASPKWLGRQHFDIYLPEYNIAIEYQGEQHYRPISFFGGEDAYLKNVERDERKRKLCVTNKCFLLYVKEGYRLDELIATISQKLGDDYKKATTPKQVPPPKVPVEKQIPTCIKHDNCKGNSDLHITLENFIKRLKTMFNLKYLYKNFNKRI